MAKRLGELAVTVSKSDNCMLQIYNKEVVVHMGEGNARRTFICNVADDKSIEKVIAFLHSGIKI